MKQSLEERFWSKVDKLSNPNGCWEWISTISKCGYGQIWTLSPVVWSKQGQSF